MSVVADMSILRSKRTWKNPATEQRKLRKGALTPEQSDNVLRALRFLGKRYRTPAALAAALGVNVEAMWKARAPKRRKSARLALVVARVAGVGVDDVLAGKWPDGCECPHCGRGRRR